ncbi:MAG TPA: permease [Candidatus Aminicenantes bacterium]|nr:permease [Candidatus Aminicenantes bacterium]HNT31274.1 permease [Candidatus Aminicenantes bacterium]HOF83028.1 permease [Candidatus Aminicenantes bacterium]HOS11436.1 permease [Candidatus Aminicenantes bacterium]HOU48288.1 permease [Candidatus Aminicenantes bacterium]
MKELKIFAVLLAVFLAAYFIPFGRSSVQNAVHEAFMMLQEYARMHVLFCLVPAFFIAGAISVFVKKESVIRYLGPKANKFVAYSVASVSGTILAVCSCTVLPLFAGIYTRGAGLGPATAFLYSGPAINVLAIIMTARILGWRLGLARVIGAVVFSVIIGLLMHFFFQRKRDNPVEEAGFGLENGNVKERPLWKTALHIGSMIGILVFLNWAKSDPDVKAWDFIFRLKWILSAAFAAALVWMTAAWFKKDELKEWLSSTWTFAKQILPLLLGGVMAAGFLLGRPGHEGVIPGAVIAGLVGGNGLPANLFASVSGALMYFATLTEVPILQGLIGSGMGQGPALALLLAGPALSLPSMIVIGKIMGTRKTAVYVSLVIFMATATGLIFGAFSR